MGSSFTKSLFTGFVGCCVVESFAALDLLAEDFLAFKFGLVSVCFCALLAEAAAFVMDEVRVAAAALLTGAGLTLTGALGAASSTGAVAFSW